MMNDKQRKSLPARLWEAVLAVSEAAIDIHYRAPWLRAAPAVAHATPRAMGGRCRA